MRIAAFFRDESCGQCVPVPRRHGSPGGGCSPGCGRRDAGTRRRRAGADRRDRPGACATRRSAGSARLRRSADRVGHRAGSVPSRERESRRDRAAAPLPIAASRRMVELEIDGQRGARAEGSTILDACAPARHRHADALLRRDAAAGNVCRVCVVEVEGSRVLAPACSRKVEAGHGGATDSERVRHSRRLVLEFLASSVDLSTAPRCRATSSATTARPERFGPPAPPDPDARPRRASRATTSSPTARPRRPCAQPVKVDNELYVRDYAKCILCYKCVDACGEQYQNTFAIAVAGRGFDARISTEYVVAAARIGLRLLRQLHRRLPDRRADVQERVRPARRRDLGRVAADRDRHDLPLLRRRLQPRRCTSRTTRS